jgi:hypothetical protein
MALIRVGSEKDKSGRKHDVYLDTDDLSQEDYREFCRLEKEGKIGKAKDILIKKILHK